MFFLNFSQVRVETMSETHRKPRPVITIPQLIIYSFLVHPQIGLELLIINTFIHFKYILSKLCIYSQHYILFFWWPSHLVDLGGFFVQTLLKSLICLSHTSHLSSWSVGSWMTNRDEILARHVIPLFQNNCLSVYINTALHPFRYFVQCKKVKRKNAQGKKVIYNLFERELKQCW